jgi:hypothetical protein
VEMLHASLSNVSHPWLEEIFSAKAVLRGGVVRRAVRDVEREIGQDRFIGEIRRRGYHLVECGGQFIVICNPGQIRILC